MGYTLYIERHVEEPISPIEWRNAVQNAARFRLQQSGTLTITNPHTGESISRPLHEYDAEYLHPETKTWIANLFWSDEGRITPAHQGISTTRTTHTAKH